MPSSRRWTSIAALILLVIPVIWQAVMVATYARNIPFGDDYDLVYRFLTRARHHLIPNLTAQHNEHRLLVPRLIVYIMYKVQGIPDLITLTLIGNMFLLGLLIIIIHQIRKSNLSWYFGVPVAYFIFSPLHGTQMIWVTGALQNFGVVFFAAAAFSLFESSRPDRRVWGLIFGLMAAFTSLNGLLVPAILLGRSLIGSPERKRRPVWIWSSAGMAALCFGTYFINYTHPSHHPPLNWPMHHIPETVCHFLILMGGIAHQPLASWILGCLLVLVTVFLLFRRPWRSAPFEFSMLLFLAGSGAMISLGRTRFGQGQGLSTRYAVLYLLVPVILYILLLRTVARQRTRYLIVALTVILVAGATIRNYGVCMDAVRHQSFDLDHGIHQWVVTGSAPATESGFRGNVSSIECFHSYTFKYNNVRSEESVIIFRRRFDGYENPGSYITYSGSCCRYGARCLRSESLCRCSESSSRRPVARWTGRSGRYPRQIPGRCTAAAAV